MKAIHFSICLIFAACCAEAQVPTLSISRLAPGTAQLSWPTNFPAWQLTTSSNLNSTNWQAVTDPIFPIGTNFASFLSITNRAGFFRLQSGGSGGGCVFQATPSVIAPGGSSTLSWCPLGGTTYRLTPGPGIVTGSNYVVFPTVTTLYTLTASNVAGVISNSTLVTVTTGGGCPWLSVTGWSGALTFSYALNPVTAAYIFDLHQEANLSFQLVRTSLSTSFAEYTGYVGGTASLNDLYQDLTEAPPNTTTLIGSGPPQQSGSSLNASRFTLDINCVSNTYTFTITPNINAVLTSPSSSGTVLYPVGSANINGRTLPASVGSLSSTGTLPARGPFWTGGGDFYGVGGLGQTMFFLGVVTDTTAGSATVNWTLTPLP